MSELTLEEAVKQYNDNHKKDLISPAAKTAKLEILSYKTVETDSGQQIDEETYETQSYDLKVYQQNNYTNSFIAIRKSHQKSTGYELQIMHLLFNGPERGCCVSFMKLGDLETEGIDVIKGKSEKVSAETAAKLYATGKYLLMVKRGKKYESPPIQTFSYGMGESE